MDAALVLFLVFAFLFITAVSVEVYRNHKPTLFLRGGKEGWLSHWGYRVEVKLHRSGENGALFTRCTFWLWSRCGATIHEHVPLVGKEGVLFAGDEHFPCELRFRRIGYLVEFSLHEMRAAPVGEEAADAAA